MHRPLREGKPWRFPFIGVGEEAYSRRQDSERVGFTAAAIAELCRDLGIPIHHKLEFSLHWSR